MVPTQDVVLSILQSSTLRPFDLIPAVVVAVVLLSFAIALVSVSVRRRDFE